MNHSPRPSCRITSSSDMALLRAMQQAGIPPCYQVLYTLMHGLPMPKSLGPIGKERQRLRLSFVRVAFALRIPYSEAINHEVNAQQLSSRELLPLIGRLRDYAEARAASQSVEGGRAHG